MPAASQRTLRVSAVLGPPPIAAGSAGIISSITRRKYAGGTSRAWTAVSPAASKAATRSGRGSGLMLFSRWSVLRLPAMSILP